MDYAWTLLSADCHAEVSLPENVVEFPRARAA
jgi:hypothetical protein